MTINGNGHDNDPHADVKLNRLPPETVAELLQRAQESSPAFKPHKIRAKRQRFIMVPWHWYETLQDCSATTHRVALYLLWLHWQRKGGPIKLANKTLSFAGVSRHSKWRALRDLERRGLLHVEHRTKNNQRSDCSICNKTCLRFEAGVAKMMLQI
jgi:hypothetical protein